MHSYLFLFIRRVVEAAFNDGFLYLSLSLPRHLLASPFSTISTMSNRLQFYNKVTLITIRQDNKRILVNPLSLSLSLLGSINCIYSSGFWHNSVKESATVFPFSPPSHFSACFFLHSIMAEISGSSNGHHSVSLNIKEEATPVTSRETADWVSVPFIQKLIAEIVGTYFLIFAGGASVVVNLSKDKVITFPGISIVWGLVVMVMVYSVGHISGAHFNPAVTIAFATTKRFPWKQVPAYVIAQVLGSTLASGTLRLIFNGQQDHFAGTLPSDSYLQTFVIEFIITFYLMFVVSGVATDNRAIGELAGLAVGATVLLNVMFAGPITGASMNPARSLGPAIVSRQFKGLWIYIVAPIFGAISGALVYNTIRFTDKPLREITKSASFLKGQSRNGSS